MKKFIAIILLFLFLSPVAASAEDYSSWSYYRDIRISNPGSTLADYPVSVSVDTTTLISEGKLNGDCSDIRFSDASDNALSYWQDILTIDDFTSSESWSENTITGSVSGGSYVAQLTSTVDPHFYKNIADFDESYDHLILRYKSYTNGPTSMRVFYTDNVDCSSYSETCAQSFPIISDGSWHYLSVRITDPEWVDNDGQIDDIRFDFDYSSSTGTVYVDSIRFTNDEFWVKVPSIPSSDSTIRMYYSNPSETSESSGSSTFLAFHGTGYWSSHISQFLGTVSGPGYIVETRGSQSGGSYWQFTGISRWQSTTWSSGKNGACWGLRKTESVMRPIYFVYGSAPSNVVSDSKPLGLATYGVEAKSSEYRYYYNGEHIATKSTAPAYPINAWFDNGLGDTGTTKPLYIEWSRVRKYTSSEPTTYVLTEHDNGVIPLDSWFYTRPVTITNPGSALTEYPVRISLDTETLISDGKLNPDCSDIRVTDESDNPLSYWIESPYEFEDYALASKGATVTGSTNPSYAIDGQLDYSMYWSRTASSSETLYELGIVDLGQLREIGVIGVHLWDGDTRYYFNYKVEVSTDNVNWETWFDGTSSGTDYNGLQIIEHAGANIRYIRIQLSGNTANTGANVLEVYAYGPSSEDHIDYALSSRGATATGSSYSQHAIDGGERVDNSKGYWLRGAQQTEDLYEMGTIDLGQSRPIEEIGLHLWDGDNRYYYNYKIAVSSDNVNWDTWFDGTDSGKDYRGTQRIVQPLQNIRYIKVWLSGNTQNTGAHIIELYAYGPETSCDTGDTRIWVNIPSLPASSEKTIYLRYGNPSASDASDPDNVFDFYDDFESGLGKWSEVATSSTSNINLVSDKTYSGSNSVEVYQTVDDGDTSISKSISSSIKGILDVKFYDDTSVSGTHAIGSSNFYAGIYPSYDVYRYRVNGGSWYSSSLKRSNGWHTLRYVYDGSSAKAYIDGGLLASTTSVSQISTVSVLDVWTVNRAGIYQDNVILRKYASPEPTAQVLAESSMALPPLTMTDTSWQDSFADETGISSRADIDYFYGSVKLSHDLSWWDEDWDYMIPVTFQNSESVSLNGFDYSVILDTSSLISGGKMKSDCSDLRIIDPDTSSEIHFVIASGCNTPSTEIILRIPVLSPGSDNFIHLYHGNPFASSVDYSADFRGVYDFEDNNLYDWSFSGTKGWTISSTRHSGSYGSQNQEISDSQTSCMYRSVDVFAGSSVDFYWKVSSETNYDYLRFYIDGSEKANIHGSVDWQLKSYSLSAGTHKLKWCYTKDVSLDDGSDTGYLDDIVVNNLINPPIIPIIYYDFESNNMNGWSFSGDKGWSISSTRYSGSYGSQNKDISDSQLSCMYRSVDVPVDSPLNFYWKVSSEANYDYLRFYLDGSLKASIHGSVDWNLVSYSLYAGNHQIKWCYTKDSSISSGSDTGYVDQISILGTPGVSYTLDSGVGYSSYGAVYTVDITPPNTHIWQKFLVGKSVPSGTSITYSILDASDDSVLCTGLTGASDDISTCAGSTSSIKLKAEFETTNPSETPVMSFWNVTWVNVIVDSYSINGTILGVDGVVISGADVTIPSLSLTTTTDAAGFYELAGFDEGNYNVKAEKTDYHTNTTAMYIDHNITFDIILDISSRSIIGIVTDTSHIPLVGAHIIADNGSLNYDAYSGPGGQYSLIGVEKANYDISASKAGYVTTTRYAVPVVSHETVIDFVLGRSIAASTSPYAEVHIDPDHPNLVPAFSLGTTNQIPVLLRNPTEDYISIPLHVGSDDSTFRNLVRLNTGEYQYNDFNITLAPREERYIMIEVIAGKKGTFEIAIGPDDNPANKYDSRNVKITEAERSVFSSTPGLGSASFLAVVLVAMILIFSGQKNNKINSAA